MAPPPDYGSENRPVLKWEALDMEVRVLRLETQKTGALVTVPLHSDFLRWLESRPRGIGKASVFPELAGQRISGRKGLSVQFRDIVSQKLESQDAL